MRVQSRGLPARIREGSCSLDAYSRKEPMIYLNCPRCGLALRARDGSPEVRHCPRCIARTRAAVPMFRSPLPYSALVGEDRDAGPGNRHDRSRRLGAGWAG
jgi:hypothetical protein